MGPKVHEPPHNIAAPKSEYPESNATRKRNLNIKFCNISYRILFINISTYYVKMCIYLLSKSIHEKLKF